MRRGDWVKFIWLLAAIVVLLLLVFYAEISERRGAARKESELKAFYPEVEEDDVGYISLQKGTSATELKKEGERWLVKLSEERWFPATAEGVKEVLDYFIGLKPAELISTDRDKLGKFELTNEMALTVKLASSPEAEEPLAVVKLGKAGPDYRSVYARVDDLSSVYLLSGNKNSVFTRSAGEWRDKHPFHGNQSEIASFTVQQGKNRFAIEKGTDGQWKFAGESARPVDQNKVVEFLARLAGLVAIRLRDEEKPEMRLARPDFVVSLAVGGEEVTLTVSPETKDSKRFLRNSALDQIYELAASSFTDFPLSRENFEEKEKPAEAAATSGGDSSESAAKGENE